jgi:hypothetical protein
VVLVVDGVDHAGVATAVLLVVAGVDPLDAALLDHSDEIVGPRR